MEFKEHVIGHRASAHFFFFFFGAAHNILDNRKMWQGK